MGHHSWKDGLLLDLAGYTRPNFNRKVFRATIDKCIIILFGLLVDLESFFPDLRHDSFCDALIASLDYCIDVPGWTKSEVEKY